MTKLLKILIVIPMTTTESKRCFSTLKRIKTFLQNVMGNKRIKALALLSMKDQMVGKTKNFNETVVDHFASAKTRRMDFIFK